MSESEKNIATMEIREIFINKQDNLSDKDYKVLLSHLGTFSQDLISSLCNSTEELLISAGDSKKIIKRLFSILIEGLQNIRLHGERDGQGRQVGYVILAKSKEKYRIVMANVIHPEDYIKVEQYLEEINGYSAEQIKKTYIEVLSNEFMSHKGGAGLGFITTRMKSENPLIYSFYQLDNGQMLFTFEVEINRILN